MHFWPSITTKIIQINLVFPRAAEFIYLSIVWIRLFWNTNSKIAKIIKLIKIQTFQPQQIKTNVSFFKRELSNCFYRLKLTLFLNDVKLALGEFAPVTLSHCVGGVNDVKHWELCLVGVEVWVGDPIVHLP